MGDAKAPNLQGLSGVLERLWDEGPQPEDVLLIRNRLRPGIRSQKLCSQP